MLHNGDFIYKFNNFQHVSALTHPEEKSYLCQVLRVAGLFLVMLLYSSIGCTQNGRIDSLRAIISATKPCACPADTALVKTVLLLGRQYKKISAFDSGMACGLRALKLASAVTSYKGIGDSHNMVGEIFRSQGEIEKAMHHYLLALAAFKTIKDQRGMSVCYNNMGLVYDKRGNFPEALRSYFLALKLKDELRDTLTQGPTYVNIGNLYYKTENYANARNYFQKAVGLSTSLNDRYILSAAYFGLGNVSNDEKKYSEALSYYNEALKLKKELGDKQGIANLQCNLGNVAFYLNDFAKAVDYYQAYITLKEDIGDTYGIGAAYGNIGRTYQVQGDLKKALQFLYRGLALTEQEGILSDVETAFKSISEVHEALGNYSQSLDYYKKYVMVRDSLFNEENTKKSVQLEMNYAFDKKTAQARLEQEKRDAVVAAEGRRQRIILFAISGFGLLISGFAVFAWRSFLQKKKANAEITHQKDIIEQKQKEILDSIHYAKRIQRSLMPSEKNLEKILENVRTS